MNQNSYTPEEIDHILADIQAAIKEHQRREFLLRMDEILTAMDTASTTGEEWKEARNFIQLMDRNKFAVLAGVQTGAG